MNNRLEALLKEIKKLEAELINEIENKKQLYSYEIIKRGILFKADVITQHRQKAERIWDYLRHAKFSNVATTPVIWLNLLPAVLMDISVSLFQYSCFPIYGIPKVKRSDYVVIDRQYLQYLNPIEKVNCMYCGYFNGVIGYVQEVAARTEHYWCPIKHASKLKTVHSRYHQFSDFGDADHYHQHLSEIRHQFDELKQPPQQ